jgi:hypothetical protein
MHANCTNLAVLQQHVQLLPVRKRFRPRDSLLAMEIVPRTLQATYSLWTPFRYL